MLLRARIVLPVSSPPIENGAVRVLGNRIQSVGRWGEMVPEPGEEIVDLGESILLPGLINGHCHLDYTDMGGLIPSQKTFPDWIKAILALKASWSYSDFARSWLNGANMLLRSGVMTVLDIEAVPELGPDVWSATPLRVISCREMISLKKSAESQFQLAQTAAQWAILQQMGRGLELGLSPHAPYTTHSDVLRWAAREAQSRKWLLTTHVAESPEEFAMFRDAAGPMYEWLKPQRDMSDCGEVSPVQHLERCGYLSSRLIAAHANYLDEGDAEILGRGGVHVVHCPGSHAYFGYAPFPYHALLKAGVNICLGTDSLASVKQVGRAIPELSLFAEARAFAATYPKVSPDTILAMITSNPARALGRAGELGKIAPDALADLIALEYNGPLGTAAANTVLGKEKIVFRMKDGISLAD